MSNDNKAKFNEFARKILDALVEACPMSVELTAETLDLQKGHAEKASTSGIMGTMAFYSYSPDEQLLNSTLEWLDAEGFVRTASRDHYVATLQTLKIYNAVPHAVSTD